jgi:hypothetical protein
MRYRAAVIISVSISLISLPSTLIAKDFTVEYTESAPGRSAAAPALAVTTPSYVDTSDQPRDQVADHARRVVDEPHAADRGEYSEVAGAILAGHEKAGPVAGVARTRPGESRPATRRARAADAPRAFHRQCSFPIASPTRRTVHLRWIVRRRVDKH